MLSFAVDPRDNAGPIGACSSCCCASASMRPGETVPWVLNYSSWLSGIGGRGLVLSPTFDMQKLSLPTPGGHQPTNTDYSFSTAFNTALTASVATNAVDANGDTLAYALVTAYGVQQGALTLNPATGSFTYTPLAGFIGYDLFWYTTSDGINPPVTHAVQITVNPQSGSLAAPPAIPPIAVNLKAVNIMANAGLRFPVAISPGAKVGDIYRLTIRAPAMDCDGTTYYHVSCYDITIGKC